MGPEGPARPVSFRPKDVSRPRPERLRAVPRAPAHSLPELASAAATLRAADKHDEAVDLLLYMLAFRCPDRQVWLALAETLDASGQSQASQWALAAAAGAIGYEEGEK